MINLKDDELIPLTFDDMFTESKKKNMRKTEIEESMINIIHLKITDSFVVLRMEILEVKIFILNIGSNY